MKIILTAIVIMASITVNAIEYVPIRDADVSEPAMSITKDKEGAWLEVTAREWQDVVFTDDGEKSYIYQQGYNYQKQKGFLKTYTTDRKLVNEVYTPESGGMVSREELMKAFEIFKNHDAIHETLAKEITPIYIFGGFGYADKTPNAACYLGQRCVHVFAHTDSKDMIAHAIVKLNDQTIPYPDFDGLNAKK
ncbi:hypothetical protein [Marinicella rhabdoformis]|uniref:hypothetical protein n=1 Tax=Marinicella rhabdoformis TaxID=2580566 RepID=UPI0012AEB665|nr:hypothetical protein [Marinicella rhabdoformis]